VAKKCCRIAKIRAARVWQSRDGEEKQNTFMSKKLFILSAVAIVVGLAFVTNIINVQSIAALYVALPLGAIFLGMALMFRSFEKEMALYDLEQQNHPAQQEKNATCDCSREAHGKHAVAH
jgi:hypothetical protein